jgi:hypothetical protein
MDESYWAMRRASQGNPEALEELDRLCEEAHKPINGRWNWWAVYPEITKPSIKRYCFWSGHKPEGNYNIFVEIQPNWIMANVMKEAGLFPSASEARRNGWNKPIEPGLNHIVYNQKRGIDVFTFGM